TGAVGGSAAPDGAAAHRRSPSLVVVWCGSSGGDWPRPRTPESPSSSCRGPRALARVLGSGESSKPYGVVSARAAVPDAAQVARRASR
uniref:Uncharacterized protein n=1 Tax=Oryza glaberrima TaxID=4538 RepID=I1NT51_ORYGL